MVDRNLASALQLTEDCHDEEISSAIIALLTSAVYDPEPRKTLPEIYQLITNLGASSYLDPLNTLPLLLTCDDQGARDIISVIGECSSAKEVVIAVQEAAERLEHSLEADEEGDGEPEEQAKEAEEPPEKTKRISISNQLIALMDIYASAIPRMKLRRKSASDTLVPLLQELEAIIGPASGKATRTEGRLLLFSAATLAKRVRGWVDLVSLEDEEDVKACKAIIKRLLDSALIACEGLIQANVAQRTLEECFPRLGLRSRTESDWEEGEKAILEILEAYSSLGIFTGEINGPCSAGDLVFWAHKSSTQQDPEKLISFLLPALISSFQTNTFLDESLAVLLRGLHTRLTGNTGTTDDLPHDITVPLYGFLPSVASAHPDPPIRFQAFRILSLLLASGSQQLRFHHLVELTRDSEFPQMRVASVGLVKEALLQALSEGKENIFLGPLFLRTFGPILFRPDPPDIFSSALALKDFEETHEPARLAECLSLYYFLLQRDEQNLTGIRDKDAIQSIESNLLTPLRNNLSRWMDDPSVSKSHLHDITAIVSLKISLERVDAARAVLKQ
ncbi:hypothetical protein GALMADRAFT_252818 [Galerina marginata CBS 339.88]|uniref:Uncharacterized protein n=1 Tax=Galerina marginata (strain CBS 339.88) TaxID=685588 RepID=A0A067SP16_GALM3|nr:hypothetical protein GALMADRAFT_252818 [Galerina marginata CBS 339.88]